MEHFIHWYNQVWYNWYFWYRHEVLGLMPPNAWLMMFTFSGLILYFVWTLEEMREVMKWTDSERKRFWAEANFVTRAVMWFNCLVHLIGYITIACYVLYVIYKVLNKFKKACDI